MAVIFSSFQHILNILSSQGSCRVRRVSSHPDTDIGRSHTVNKLLRFSNHVDQSRNNSFLFCLYRLPNSCPATVNAIHTKVIMLENLCSESGGKNWPPPWLLQKVRFLAALSLQPDTVAVQNPEPSSRFRGWPEGFSRFVGNRKEKPQDFGRRSGNLPSISVKG